MPEQQSVQAERKLCELLGDGYNIGCEVLNFERLPNRVYREHGGIAREVLDDGASEAVMSLCIENLKGRLKVYGNCKLTPEFTKKICSSVNELERAGASSSILSFYADKLKGSPIGDKLSDIALIAAEYHSFLSGDVTNRDDALQTLAKDLKDKPFFKNKAVFIDGYFDFSAVEYEILKEILNQSAQTYITVLDDEDDDTGLFDLTRKTSEKIKELSKGRSNDIKLCPQEKSATDTLTFAEKNFYKQKSEKEKKEDNDGSFTVTECSNIFDEAEFAASRVMALAKRGLRYREISVVMRNTDDYEGVIDLVFKKYGIPFYFADKDSAAEKSLCTLISAIFEIASDDFSIKSIKKYLKSSFSALSIVECDALISYIETWKIRGKKRYAEDEWAMNPDGYKNSLSKRDAFTLSRVNIAKKKLTSTLLPLCETLNQKHVTVKSALTAVFEHLKEIGADSKLERRAEKAANDCNEDEKGKLSMLWESITRSFDTLCSLCGDKELTPNRISDLLSLILSSKKLGSIPVSLDCVNIGSASLIRPDNCRAIIILGANEGIFPAAPSQNGLFSASEACELLNLGLDLNISPENENKKENFAFYYICSCPSDDLSLAYHSLDTSCKECKISSAVLFLTSLFNMSIQTFKERDKLFCKKALLDNISALSGKELESAHNYYGNDKDFSEALDASRQKLSEAEAKISYAEGKELYLSSTRLETYRKCPFSYFSRYLLDLKTPKEANFASLEVGNFFHEILEAFMKKRTESGSFVAVDDDTLKAEVDEYTQKYIIATAGGALNVTPRLRYTFNKFKKSLFLLFKNIIDEFSLCSFQVCGIEEKINARYNDGETTVMLGGKIDRIDMLKKGEKTYIRVTDYKTGNKKFDIEAVENGLDMQMLIYLFAYMDQMQKKEKTSDILPGGILYMPVLLQSDESEYSESDVNSKFKRSGIVIDDKEIVEEMEHGMAGMFIPVKAKKGGEFYAFSSLASLETFGKLKSDVSETVISLAKEIRNGKMNATPFKFKGKSPCTYCEMKPFCRVTNSYNTILSKKEEEQ